MLLGPIAPIPVLLVPRQQIAILKLKGLVVDTVDGRAATDTHCNKDIWHPHGDPKFCHVRTHFFNAIELLPGDHTIVFRAVGSWTAGYGLAGTPVTNPIHVDAGKAYQAKFRREGRYSYYGNDGMYRPTSPPTAHWWVEISEHK